MYFNILQTLIIHANSKNKSIITEYKLGEYSFLSSWGANHLSTVQGIKSIKNHYGFMELLTKAYDLPYSDSRLIQIETLLKSLSNKPSGTDTLIEQPIILETLKSFTNSLNIK